MSWHLGIYLKDKNFQKVLIKNKVKVDLKAFLLQQPKMFIDLPHFMQLSKWKSDFIVKGIKRWLWGFLLNNSIHQRFSLNGDLTSIYTMTGFIKIWYTQFKEMDLLSRMWHTQITNKRRGSWATNWQVDKKSVFSYLDCGASTDWKKKNTQLSKKKNRKKNRIIFGPRDHHSEWETSCCGWRPSACTSLLATVLGLPMLRWKPLNKTTTHREVLFT